MKAESQKEKTPRKWKRKICSSPVLKQKRKKTEPKSPVQERKRERKRKKTQNYVLRIQRKQSSDAENPGVQREREKEKICPIHEKTKNEKWKKRAGKVELSRKTSPESRKWKEKEKTESIGELYERTWKKERERDPGTVWTRDDEESPMRERKEEKTKLWNEKENCLWKRDYIVYVLHVILYTYMFV